MSGRTQLRMPDTPTKLDHALALAKRGFRVFPLLPNLKLPAIKEYQNQATTDPARIREWWLSFWPDANIGIETTGLCVLDVDAKPGKPGRESLEFLLDLHGQLPPTYAQRTPTGGMHFVFSAPPGVDIRNSAGKIAPGLDIRGWHGFIVAAGSTIDGRPYRGGDKPIAQAPQWLLDAARAATPPREERDLPPAAELDTPTATKRATEYLQSADPAIQGAGGDDQTYRTAARVKDIGVSQQEAVALMLEHWNERCQPPWDPDDLRDKVANAYRYGENAPGSASAEADFKDVPLPPPISPPASIESPAAHAGPRVISWDDEDNTPEPDPLVDGLFDLGDSVLIYGAPGVGKSFVAQKVTHCVASGTPFAGRDVTQGSVLYVATEGHTGIRKRRKAMRKRLGGTGLPIDFLLVHVNLARNKADRETIRAAGAALVKRTGQPIRAIIFDTMSAASPGMDENAAGEVSAVLQAMRAIAASFGATAIIVHHEGKNGSNGPRGSSAFTGNVDVQIRVTPGLIESDKERENAPMAPLRFDLDVVEVGRTRKGRVVTSCVARVYSEAESDFQRVAMDGVERRAYDVLKPLCEAAAEDGAAVGRVAFAAWRQAYKESVFGTSGAMNNAQRQQWGRAVEGLRSKQWIRDDGADRVIIDEAKP